MPTRPTRQVLGVLDLEMSTAPMAAALGAAKVHFLWATGILTIIILAVVAVFIRRGLQTPISRLCAGTRRIAAGDLDSRVEVRGHDELAELAEAFNHMAEDLSAARREVTQWSQNLERKVAEKTAELQQAQRQVLHMEKMASLGKLSATVAHEINNPLTGMLVYAELSRRDLQEQPLDPAVREEVMRYLSVIERECRRCGGIVQNLLFFARRSGASMAPVDVNDVVRQSLMLVEHHLHMSGLKLKAEFLEGDSRITADGGQLQQALVALLVNAVEAMSGLPEGRGELTVRAARHGRTRSEIDIGDNGIGIPGDVLPQDLRAVLFHQGGRKRRRAGVVGGLWDRPAAWRPDRRRLAGRQRNDISLDAAAAAAASRHGELTTLQERKRRMAEDAGSCIPICRVSVKSPQARKDLSMAPALARILIVDDEFSVRDSLDHWFRKDGYEVQTAADAAEATAAMQSGAFDVVLLDVRLPGMDGMRLLEQIRRTAPGDDRDHDHGLCLGRYGRAGPETGRRGLRHQADQPGGAQPRGGAGPGPAALARGEPATAGHHRRNGRRPARSSARVRPCGRSWS